MRRNGRWPINVLENMKPFKGDTSSTRPRTILTDQEFETLLATTLAGPDRRNLTGEQRYWLYLVASQSGLRAQELNSLKPTSFDLDSDPATVTVHCTISKRRKTDTILLSRDFARMLRRWLDEQDPDRRLWGCSTSWFYKAGSMLRADLEAARNRTRAGRCGDRFPFVPVLQGHAGNHVREEQSRRDVRSAVVERGTVGCGTRKSRRLRLPISSRPCRCRGCR